MFNEGSPVTGAVSNLISPFVDVLNGMNFQLKQSYGPECLNKGANMFTDSFIEQSSPNILGGLLNPFG